MFTRICLNCSEVVIHKTKRSRDVAEKANRSCRSCNASEINKRHGLRDDFIKKYASPGCSVGESNPFYGKKHTQETISLLKEVDKSHLKTDTFRKKMCEVVAKGEDHPMYGTNTYQVWLSKYGKEKADELDLERRKKWSAASAGSKNPMFGKPSPQGSGNGWSGWYNNWYFRSLRELCYVIHTLEPSEMSWVAAEKAGVRIIYQDWNETQRTYVPDFLVGGSKLVEIKPIRLATTPMVSLKAAAAREYCKDHGWSYEVIDPGILSEKEVYDLRISGRIRFTERYEKLYQERYVR
jgi:hypothetical protein